VTEYTAIAGCSAVDVACVCLDLPTSGLPCCVVSACSGADQAAVGSYVQALCSANGIEVFSPLTCNSTTPNANGISSLASISHVSPTSKTVSISTTLFIGTSLESASYTSTGSSTTSTIAASKNGPSAGAKAGIAIGAIGVILLILLLTFFLLLHRKSKAAGNSEEPLPFEGELSTKSSMHQIDGRITSYPTLDNLDEEYEVLPSISELPAEKQIYTFQSEELSTPANNHELDAGPPVADPQNWELEQNQVPQQTFSQPYQPDYEAFGSDVGKGNGAAEAVAVQHEPDSSRVASEAVLSATSTSASSSRIDGLRAKRDKIKVEKERLLKLQELDEMDAAVQYEIREEQRMSAGKFT